MRKLTITFLIEGLNRRILFERLIKHGVNLLNIKDIDKKHAEITIDNKDCPIFFAICKNTWYNKRIKVGGYASPLYYALIVFPAATLAALIFTILAFIGGNVFFGAEYLDDGLLYRAETEAALADAGVEKFGFFSQDQLNSVEKKLVGIGGIGYVRLQKSGNRAIIDIKRLKDQPNLPIVSDNDLIADEDITILNITVYSGTPLCKKGDEISKGEIIAAAYEIVDEEKIPCKLFVCVTAKCRFEYVYKSIYGGESGALAAAKFMLGDYTVLSNSVKREGKTIKVTLYYEKMLCGG